MTLTEREIRALTHLINGDVEAMLKRVNTELTETQRLLRDETELRWNQGKQQLLFEILDMIRTSRERLEALERRASKPVINKTLAF